ncbi:MAG: excinuclease ABC subunit UvrC [Candidatus Kerfeldbacteria bacterium]
MEFPKNVTETLQKLPAKPGVYIFKDATKNVLYVGKANRLRSRVKSYFRQSATLDPIKRIMVGRIAELDYIIVSTETEALLLESTLIKRHHPPFNVIFRDDKYYQYIRIAIKDDFPRVDTVRRIARDGSRYFGPYTSGHAVQQTLKLLKRIFPYKSCVEPPSRLCFDARLGRCLGHDFGPGSKKAYRDIIDKLIRFLKGDTDTVLRDLKTSMKQVAKERQFELAARYRDRIFAIQKVAAEQKVVSTQQENQDTIGIARIGDVAAVNLFQVRAGKLINRQYHVLQHVEPLSDAEVLASFAAQYYAESSDRPRSVVTRVLPVGVSNLSTLLRLIFEAPTRGKKRKLVQLAEENAADYLAQRQKEWLSREARIKLGLANLQRALLFPDPPERIECYDISNVQGANAVGSMVVFEHGVPKKTEYRKFNIKTVKGSNDYAMLQEVIRRRFDHHSPPARGGVPEGRGGGSSSPARGRRRTTAGMATAREDVAKRQEGWEDPDLIIIDGGKGQLNAVLAVLRELNIMIPTIGLAKRLEEIFRPGMKEPLRLAKDSEGLFLLQRIRDEAHRFAIGSFRLRHERATKQSLLDEVPCIGPALKKKLLARFGSVEGIRLADDNDIETVIGKHRTAILREHL